MFISGIGCSSRFPYYMNTYGMHSIHGRAPAIATGLATSRPDLKVFVVTGDGDALSIGGNHLIHALRRNVNLTILLFNNRIYGLTKGQYSPTSEQGKITKSTPFGSVDHPFNPVSLALGAEATFVGRTLDSDRAHLTSVLRAATEHEGASLVEIYQNCNIFNDGAFDLLKDPDTRGEWIIPLEHGQPVRFGGGDKAVVRDPSHRQPDHRGGRRRRRQPGGGARRARRRPVLCFRTVAAGPARQQAVADGRVPRCPARQLRPARQRPGRCRAGQCARATTPRWSNCSGAVIPGPSASRRWHSR